MLSDKFSFEHNTKVCNFILKSVDQNLHCRLQGDGDPFSKLDDSDIQAILKDSSTKEVDEIMINETELQWNLYLKDVIQTSYLLQYDHIDIKKRESFKYFYDNSTIIPLLQYLSHMQHLLALKGLMHLNNYSFELLMHDIDKLHPLNLIGYRDRFVNDKATHAWDIALERHYFLNQHHQQNQFWKSEENVGTEKEMNYLREMVCDKTCVRMEKQCNSQFLHENLWNWDELKGYFAGLNERCLSICEDIVKNMNKEMQMIRSSLKSVTNRLLVIHSYIPPSNFDSSDYVPRFFTMENEIELKEIFIPFGTRRSNINEIKNATSCIRRRLDMDSAVLIFE